MKYDLVKRQPITDEYFNIFYEKIADMTNIHFGFWSKFNIICCKCFEGKTIEYNYYQKGKKKIEHELDLRKLIKHNLI